MINTDSNASSRNAARDEYQTKLRSPLVRTHPIFDPNRAAMYDSSCSGASLAGFLLLRSALFRESRKGSGKEDNLIYAFTQLCV